MIKMKKLSAATFAMALSIGGLSLAGCTKDDKAKDKPAEKAAPAGETVTADTPKEGDKPTKPEVKDETKKPTEEVAKPTEEVAKPDDKVGSAAVEVVAKRDVVKPNVTIKKPKPKGCGGPNGCGGNKRADKDGKLKISKDDVKNPINAKEEVKKKKDGSCGAGSCG